MLFLCIIYHILWESISLGRWSLQEATQCISTEDQGLCWQSRPHHNCHWLQVQVCLQDQEESGLPEGLGGDSDAADKDTNGPDNAEEAPEDVNMAEPIGEKDTPLCQICFLHRALHCTRCKTEPRRSASRSVKDATTCKSSF